MTHAIFRVPSPGPQKLASHTISWYVVKTAGIICTGSAGFSMSWEDHRIFTEASDTFVLTSVLPFLIRLRYTALVPLLGFLVSRHLQSHSDMQCLCRWLKDPNVQYDELHINLRCNVGQE